MELYWMIVSHAFVIINILIMGYCYSRFAKPFLEEKRGACLIGFAYSAVMIFLYVIPAPVENFLAYSLGVLAALAVMCGIDSRNYQQKIFLAFTFFALRWLVVALAGVVFHLTYDLAVESAYMYRHPRLQFAVYAGLQILDSGLEFAVLMISIRYIVKAYTYKQDNMTWKEMLMLTGPSLTGMTGYGIMRYYQNFCQGETWSKQTRVYAGLSFLHYGISIITIVVVIVLFQSIRARQEEALQNEWLGRQIDSIKQHMEQAERLYGDIRSVKHDMTNHIMTLERLYAGNAMEESRAYVENLKESLRSVTEEIRSGNPVTDAILNQWKNRAESRGIRFLCDLRYPSDTGINAFDISVILNNALENAVEGTMSSENPWISLRSYHEHHAYVIEICNCFEGKLRWNQESGLPVTSKGKAECHGYGLANIRRVARSYYGDMDVVQEAVLGEQQFRLNVMLMLEGRRDALQQKIDIS